MSLNDTPAGERVHIGFFGRRNAGKSSLVNAFINQELAVVSEIPGTTTDPVLKSMELLPIGPVVIIDTAGTDDEGVLGEKRVSKTMQILNKTDIAVLVVDATSGMQREDEALLARIRAKNIPCLIAWNKCELLPPEQAQPEDETQLYVSAETGKNIPALRAKIAGMYRDPDAGKTIACDLVPSGSVVVLVTPIDSAAPKGRLILPQQQVVRDLLEGGNLCFVTRETEYATTLKKLNAPPALVITDSQAFAKVATETPLSIPLTSFSILFARYKGILKQAVAGAAVIDTLRDGDQILISEGCTHHRQCDDIGTVKLPRWLLERTGAQLRATYSSGTGFPEDLTPFKLIIHCGACMLNEREVRYRYQCAADAGVPITNYGTAIAYMKGILSRTTAMLDLS